MQHRHAGLWACVVLGGVLVGCRSYDVQPTAVPDAANYKACMSTEADIGPDGGEIDLGPYALMIPAGALSYTTHITMDQVSCGLWPVVLGPDGTQFSVPATLRFDASSEAFP